MIPKSEDNAQYEQHGNKRPYCRSDTASETQSDQDNDSRGDEQSNNNVKRARFGDPEPSVSVDMSESTKRERLEAEDGLGADGGGKNSDPGKGDIQGAAAIMADCLAIPFPKELPSPHQAKRLLAHRKFGTTSVKLSDELVSKPDDDSSLMPQASPEDIQTTVPNYSPHNHESFSHPSWLLSTAQSTIHKGNQHIPNPNGQSRVSGSSMPSSPVSQSKENPGSCNTTNNSNGNTSFGPYRDTNHGNGESTSSGSGNLSSYGSNQRTQGSSLSQRSNLIGSSMEDSNSTREKQNLLDPISIPSSGDATFTTIAESQPGPIQDEMSVLMSDWSLLHIKFSSSRSQTDVEFANRRIKKVLLQSNATKMAKLQKNEAIPSPA